MSLSSTTLRMSCSNFGALPCAFSTCLHRRADDALVHVADGGDDAVVACCRRSRCDVAHAAAVDADDGDAELVGGGARPWRRRLLRRRPAGGGRQRAAAARNADSVRKRRRSMRRMEESLRGGGGTEGIGLIYPPRPPRSIICRCHLPSGRAILPAGRLVRHGQKTGAPPPRGDGNPCLGGGCQAPGRPLPVGWRRSHRANPERLPRLAVRRYDDVGGAVHGGAGGRGWPRRDET